MGWGCILFTSGAKAIIRIPLLLIHGWPDSFVRFLQVIPLLTAEGPDGLSFDVIVPSIPGFGFSDRPVEPGMNAERIARLFAHLMKDQLGYSCWICHGGDWGSSITMQMARLYPDRLLGIHMTDLPAWNLTDLSALGELKPAEKEYMESVQQWYRTEGAYGMLQSTKPQTLAYAMNDSPIGLAGWIIEKFHAWTDHSGELEKKFTRDQLLTNLTIYWVTQTAGSSFRLYYETLHHPSSLAAGRIEVPAGICIAPKDFVPVPREFAERILDVRHWTALSEGGHFLAMEQPEALADDIFRFASALRVSGRHTPEPAIPLRM